MMTAQSLGLLVLAAAVGGAWGGTLIGLAEATLIVATSGPGEEFWLFPYAATAYGLVGMLLGIVFSLFATIATAASIRLGRDFASAAGIAFFLLGSVVVRYHVIQRVFEEQLVTLSSIGVLVHVLLLAVMAGLTGAVMVLGRRAQRAAHGVVISAASLLLCVAVAAGAAVLAAPRVGQLPGTRVATATANGHPNVILIIADTLRADALGVYGAGPAATPNMDRFAADAVRFTHASAQSSWTRPSIATILTSLYASVHGAIHKMDPLPDAVTTIAEVFRSQGYWTTGFVSNINVAPVFNFQQGFEEYEYLPPDFYFGATDSATRLAIYKGLRVVRERLFPEHIYFYHYYQDAQVMNAAVLPWLAGNPPAPFFLFLHYMDPHDPYFEIPYNGHGVARVTNPNPPASRVGELRKLYREDVSYLDENLGTLFKRLKELGLYDTSVIALTADHGEEFQDHGGWWHGTTLYEEQVHVPLLVKRAREAGAADANLQPARLLDVTPTLVAAAGLSSPSTFQGRDLFGPPAAAAPVLFAEQELEGNVLSSVRVGDWKMIAANQGNPRGLQPVELYDLSRDAGEHQNLAAAEPARAQEMLRLLAQTRGTLLHRGG